MLKKVLKRIKSEKGLSGVLVALMLVMVGVGLVAGINSFMEDSKDTIINDANTSIQGALVNG